MQQENYNGGIRLTPINVEQTTKDTCLRPDIILYGPCEPCNYFERCQLPGKKINGKAPKIEKV